MSEKTFLILGFVTTAIFPIVNFLSPGINEAVERIIALHELDRVKITLELLNQWLQPEAALQATMNESMLNVSEESDEEHIKRSLLHLFWCHWRI